MVAVVAFLRISFRSSSNPVIRVLNTISREPSRDTKRTTFAGPEIVGVVNFWSSETSPQSIATSLPTKLRARMVASEIETIRASRLLKNPTLDAGAA